MEREAKKAAAEEAEQAELERSRLRRAKEIEEEIVRKATESQAQLLERRENEIEEEEARRIQKAQMALRSVAERALEDKQKHNAPTQLELEDEVGVGAGDGSSSFVATTTTTPPAATSTPSSVSIDASTLSIATVGVVEQPTIAVPIMKSLDPPPPSLNSMQIPLEAIGSEEMVGHGMNSRVLLEQQHRQQRQQQQQDPEPQLLETRTMKPDPPPSFDEQQQLRYYASVPSTKAPPPAAFHQVKQQPIDPPTLVENDSMDEYDESGNHLTPEQRQALLDEQRKLYESIMKEKAENDAAIAKANADLFDMRSSNAVARTMAGTDSLARRISAETTAAPGGVLAASSNVGQVGTVAAPTATLASLSSSSSSQRMITIGSNQSVALHGQEITRKAISDGTAILIQCVNCHNWMQVTGKATLMLCPICRVVSPVVKQNEVLTREQAMQLTKDRELAEKLQAEMNHGEEGGVANDNVDSAASQHESDSWWNRLSSIVSYGVADETHQRGEVGVTRPPGSAAPATSLQYPAQRRGNFSSVTRPSVEPSDEMVGHGMNSRFLSEQQRRMTVSPSAPPHAAVDLLDHLHPVAPPSSSTGETQPSTVDDEGIDAISEFDENGNHLTLEQRRTLLNEQRRLYESIMKEKADNDAAIAAAQADSFNMRSSSAAARVMPGRDGAESSAAPGEGAAAASSAGEQEDTPTPSSQRRIKIGSRQTVSLRLRGQESTRKAISDAIIVQCINCQHWMQITGSATLMLCPICQVVSPVTKQNEVLTKEEAIQLTIDRKLAEKLQAEINDGEGPRTKTEEGFFSRVFGGSASDSVVSASSPPSTSSTTVAQDQSDSWWNRISSMVAYGEDDGAHHRGELGVTRPPGSHVGAASQYPAQLRGNNSSVASAATNFASQYSTHNEETRGLLVPVVVDGNEENLPPGRVAERQPLFSCLVNSVSSASAALFTTAETDSEGNVHGVDGSSLLVTNAGRGVGDTSGDYSRLSDHEYNL